MTGDYREAMRLGIAHNGEVMKARGGAPWVVEEDGRLRVRLREEGADLSGISGLPMLWCNQPEHAWITIPEHRWMSVTSLIRQYLFRDTVEILLPAQEQLVAGDGGGSAEAVLEKVEC